MKQKTRRQRGTKRRTFKCISMSPCHMLESLCILACLRDSSGYCISTCNTGTIILHPGSNLATATFIYTIIKFNSGARFSANAEQAEINEASSVAI